MHCSPRKYPTILAILLMALVAPPLTSEGLVRASIAEELATGTVTGVVVSSTAGLPISGATITYTDSATSATATATTSANGTFLVLNLPISSSGRITVTAPGNHASAAIPAPVGPGLITALPVVTLVPGTTPIGNVSGVVLSSPFGLPISGATVTYTDPATGLTAIASSAANGSYAFIGLPISSSGRITVSAPGMTASIPIPAVVVPNITTALPTIVLTVTPTPTGGASGVIINSSTGLPIGGARVRYTDPLTGLTVTIFTAPNGSFIFFNLPVSLTGSITASALGTTASAPLPVPIAVSITIAMPPIALTPTSNSFGFAQATNNVFEGSVSTTVTVSRAGDRSTGATVDYASNDGSARERSDHITKLGTLRFAPGDQSKSFELLLTEDSKVEGDESLSIVLSDATGNTAVGAQNTTTITIVDNSPEISGNPNDDANLFVRQQYNDFLNRQADPNGQAFWTQEITGCGANAACTNFKRTNTSGAFFLSIEFQQTGFFVIRTYRTAFSRRSSNPYGTATQRLTYREFLKDSQEISEGVVVNDPGWTEKLESNTVAYLQRFVERVDFKAEYPEGMPAAQYVDKLYTRAGLSAASASKRQEAIDAYGSGDNAGRAAALRSVVNSSELTEQSANPLSEFGPAFVLMEYFGYLRRNPDECGFNFWLAKLNAANGDFNRAEMVRSFLVSDEYRQRFAGPDYTDAQIPICP